MKKPFIVANVREITDAWDREEISYSRMVEMLNEIAEKFYDGKASPGEGAVIVEPADDKENWVTVQQFAAAVDNHRKLWDDYLKTN